MSSDELNQLSRQIDNIAEKIDNLDNVLRGDGKEPGIVGRLDRLEQKEATRSKVAWTGLTLAVGTAGAWAKSLFTSGN